MNALNPLSNRQLSNTPQPAVSQPPAEGKHARASQVQGLTPDNAVSLSSNGIDLQKRVEKLGNATVGVAQNLLGNFAQKLFGDAGKGATIDFDSVSLETDSSFAAAALHSEGAGGVTDAAGFSLSDNSHFLGKGTITTADGRKFDFEVEIKYEARQSTIGASSVPSRRAQLADQNPAMPLPKVEFPDIDFPGSLADLFRLMDRTVKGDVKEEGSESVMGSLQMRLLKLVDSESTLDALPPPANDKARSVAHAYGLHQTEPGQAAELAHAAKAARDVRAEVPAEPAPAPAPAPAEPPVAQAEPATEPAA